MQVDSAQTPSLTGSHILSHSKTKARNDKIIRNPDHPANLDMSQTHFFQRCSFSCVSHAPQMLMTMQVTSHRCPVVTVWLASLSPSLFHTRTHWHHTQCLSLSGSLGRVESSRNSQPILGPLSCPVTLSLSPQRPHQPRCHRPCHIRHNPTWMHSLTPHIPTHTGGQVGTYLSQKKVWCGGTLSQAPLGHCTPLAWPHPCLLPSPLYPQRGWFRSSHPLAGSLAEEGRWFREFGLGLGRGFGSPGPKDPGGVGARGLAPGLPVSPSYSELGADSASQDTSLQSACEGGPCRLGPLHPLPSALPGPPQPHPGVLLGPFPWTPAHLFGQTTWRFSWLQPMDLQLKAAHPAAFPQ